MGKTLEEACVTKKTDHICADCGEDIVYTDEVFRLQVVKAQWYQGRLMYHPVIDEHDPAAPFQFEPFHFCFSCWEKNYEDVRSDMTDEPPVEDAQSLFECVCCGSGIRALELAGLFALGEFRLSDRSPSNVRGAQFLQINNPDLLCIYCLTALNNDHIDMWEDLTESGECMDCMQARCWRTVGCDCRCHWEPSEEQEEQEEY